MMGALRSEEIFRCLPIRIDNTSVLHVAGNKIYSSSVKHVILKLFAVREIIPEGKISIHYCTFQPRPI